MVRSPGSADRGEKVNDVAGDRRKDDNKITSFGERIKIILFDPGIIQVFISYLMLLVHIRSIRAFKKALRDQGWEEAASYTDLSKDELLIEVEQLRRESQRLGKAFFG